MSSSPSDDILRQSFAAAVGKTVDDPFLQADLRSMVELLIRTTGGDLFRKPEGGGLWTVEQLWPSIDAAATPYYGQAIRVVPLRDIYNASPAALNVGNVMHLALTGLAAEVAKAAAPIAVLGGIVAMGLVGARMVVSGARG